MLPADTRVVKVNGLPALTSPSGARRLLENWNGAVTLREAELNRRIIQILKQLERLIGIGAAAVVAPIMLNQFAPSMDGHEVARAIAMGLASVSGATCMTAFEIAGEQARKETEKLLKAH